MRRLIAAMGLVLIFGSVAAHAKDLCREYANYTPLPKWYPELCSKGGGGSFKAKVGGAYSTFGDAFNLNPAAIITSKIPLGVEYVRSWSGSSTGKNNFAFIKGLGHVGAAITTNSDETFYGNSVFQTPGSTYDPLNPTANSLTESFFPTLNFGTALDVGHFLERYKLDFLSSITVGLMGKYNKTTKAFTPAFGFTWQIWFLTFGYSYTQDPANGTSPTARYDTFTLGVKTSIFQLEGVLISNKAELYGISLVRPAFFVTLSSKIGPLLISGAFRSYQDVLQTSRTQYHFAIDYLLTPKIAIGYLENYVVDHHSLGLQVMF